MKLDPYWKKVASELPDSRLKDRARGTIYSRGGNLEPVFCAQCGRPGGGVSADIIPHIYYVCTECVHTNGPPPGAVEVTKEV